MKNVFITGASAGLGRALAFEFASHGHNLILVARREELLLSLKTEIQSRYPKVTVLIAAADVTDAIALTAAAQKARQDLGLIDTVIVNAGFGVTGNIEDLGLPDFERQFDVNVFGALKTIYATLADVKDARGRICLVGSTSAYLTVPTTTAYCMSKFAVRSLAEGLSAELTQYGVSVTLINPGFIATDIRKTTRDGKLSKESADPVPAWLQMPAPKAAQKIYSAVRRRKRERAITIHSQLGIWLARFFPGLVAFIMKRTVQPRH